MATYGWYPLNISNPLAYTWSPTGNWGAGADWANLASTTFPPSTGTVPGPGDTAYILSANAPSFFIPAPFPMPPYSVAITVNSAQTVGSLGMAKFEPFSPIVTANKPVIDVVGVSFFVIGSIVDNYTATFPSPINTETVSGGGIINLASSASLRVGTTIDAGITVHFNDGSDKVILDGVNSANQNAAHGMFTNFQSGDVINLSSVASAGAVISSYNVSSGALTITTSGTVDAVLFIKGISLTISSFSLQADLGGGLDIVTCFAAGTCIRTLDGDVVIEALREGDAVTVRDPQINKETTAAIRWIGRRRINLRRHRQPEQVSPIRIRRDACAEGVPARDLLVSPEHALLLDDVLVPARLLVNGTTIVQETNLPAVQYFHLELDHHAILLAEGMPAESYLDTGNRGLFENIAAATLHPSFPVPTALDWSKDACAPLAVEPSQVEPIWRRLADRAASLGFSMSNTKPTVAAVCPMLEVDGKMLTSLTSQPGHHLFALPPGVHNSIVRLRSGAARPSDRTPWLDDRRLLGIMIERILLHDQGVVTELPLDHPALTTGWWNTERDANRLWRWTNGNAAFSVSEGTQIVEIRTAGAAPVLSAISHAA